MTIEFSKEVELLFGKVVPNDMKKGFKIARDLNKEACKKWHDKLTKKEINKLNAKRRERYSRNPTKRSEYYYKNRDKILARQRKYRAANQQKCNEISRLWYSNNKERSCERCKEYYQKNKEALSAKAKKRYARKKALRREKK